MWERMGGGGEVLPVSTVTGRVPSVGDNFLQTWRYFKSAALPDATARGPRPLRRANVSSESSALQSEQERASSRPFPTKMAAGIKRHRRDYRDRRGGGEKGGSKRQNFNATQSRGG